jgi:hypothetical protein
MLMIMVKEFVALLLVALLDHHHCMRTRIGVLPICSSVVAAEE